MGKATGCSADLGIGEVARLRCRSSRFGYGCALVRCVVGSFSRFTPQVRWGYKVSDHGVDRVVTFPQVETRGSQGKVPPGLGTSGQGRPPLRPVGWFWVWLCPGRMRVCIGNSRRTIILFRLDPRVEPGVTVWGRAGSLWALPRSCISRCQSPTSEGWCARLLHARESEGCRSRGRVPLRRCAACC